MKPHPVLAAHYESLADKQRYLRRIFDRTAPHYEGIVRWGFFGSGSWYRREALKRGGLQPGMRVLDIAAGTGPTSRAVAEIIGDPQRVVCIDNSSGMLVENRRQLAARFVQAVADRLPLRSGSFDFLTMAFALRHVETLETAFREYARVLKPGAKVLLLDTIKPRNAPAQLLFRLYFRDILAWCSGKLTGNAETSTLVKYYYESMNQMVRTEDVLAALQAAGFTNVQHRVFFGIFCEYEGTKA